MKAQKKLDEKKNQTNKKNTHNFVSKTAREINPVKRKEVSPSIGAYNPQNNTIADNCRKKIE